MTLNDLETLVDHAKTSKDIFGDEDPAVVLKRFRIKFHPDRFENGSEEFILAGKLIQALVEWESFANKPLQILTSPKREYTLHALRASGDLCDVYYATSEDEEYIVKVSRVSGRASSNLLAKEKEILEQLSEHSKTTDYRHYFPTPEDTFLIGTPETRVNVVKWKEGLFTAEEILKKHPHGLDGRHVAWMFKRLLTGLGFVHAQGWVHGAILPSHVMFQTGNHGMVLTGWIHSVKPEKPIKLVPRKYKDWYPDECKKKSGPESDIYMAAKVMLYLAHPNGLPHKMYKFLISCLLESPSMRPNDAWKLHEEFTLLLDGLYGPPKFAELEMS